jgi:iron complex transport system ATP-binding protein
MLIANNLLFSYGDKRILYNIDFHAGRSEIISLIGPNGSGKSTLLRCLSGLLRTTVPSVHINGTPIEQFKTKDVAKKIAFLPQFQERMNGISVHQLVCMGRAPYQSSGWLWTREDKEKVRWAMNYMRIEGMKNRMVNTLSGGEKQRVWIAMILAQDTPIMLLDEPVTYLDMKHQWNLLNTINDLKENYQKTIISVFHNVNHALETSDMIYMLKDGRIYSSGDAEDIISEIAIKHVYGVNAYVCDFQKCRQKVVVTESIKKYKPATLTRPDLIL